MKPWFQKFGFRETAYDRPNQKWVCGRACLGEECPYGPDFSGECQVVKECQPIRQGGRWMCNRTRAGSDVKPCQDGPSPEGVCCRPMARCTPVRSLRAKRGLVTLGVSAFALGFLMLLLTHRVGSRFVTPGELSHSHSAADSRCADCHTPGEGLAIDWLHAMDMKSAAPDSGKCVNCHPMGEQPLNPHSLPLELLSGIRKRVLAAEPVPAREVPTGLKLAALGFVPNEIREGPIRCAACHVEHKGKEHDLKALSNTQCQVCHSVQFSSFEHGHPGFGGYPFERATRIVFDHERHLKQHFKEAAMLASAPADCLSCHVLDERGATVVTRGYEQSCAACHSKDFAGTDESAPGIAFLRVPLVDVEGLEEAEQKVGEWPDDWDSLGTTLTPFVRVLLSHDPALRDIVRKMGARDLDSFEDETVSSGARLVWAFKELLHDLATEGPAALERRLAAALDRTLSPAELAELRRIFTPALFSKTVARWFPKLGEEIKALRDGDAPESTFMEIDEMEERLSLDAVALGGNWARSDADLTLYYRPAHHGDSFMKLWLELTAGGGTNAVGELGRELAGNHQRVVPGRCAKCHTEEPDALKKVNWNARRPDHLEHTFSRFSHEAHFSLLDERACVSCHRMNFGTADMGYLSSFTYHGGGPGSPHFGNFKAIDKATCAVCHTKNKAGEGCLTCHNYHVGRFEGTRLKASMFEQLQGDQAQGGR